MQYNVTNEYLESLVNGYNRMLASTVVNNVMVSDEPNRSFVMTAHNGVVLGLSIHPVPGGGKRVLMLGYSDDMLLGVIGQSSKWQENAIRELLKGSNEKDPNIYNVFYTPNQDLVYYEKYPLVSIEYLIPDEVLDLELVTKVHNLLCHYINVVEDILTPRN